MKLGHILQRPERFTIAARPHRGPHGGGLADYATVRRTRAYEWIDGPSDSGMADRASDRGSSGLAGSGRTQLDGPAGGKAKSSPIAPDNATAGKGGPAS